MALCVVVAIADDASILRRPSFCVYRGSQRKEFRDDAAQLEQVWHHLRQRVHVERAVEVGTEFYYYDNKLVVAEEETTGSNCTSVWGRISSRESATERSRRSRLLHNAVYLFDKNERSGSQIDRFDESLFWGVEQQCQVTKNLRVSLGVIHSKFERSSFYTSSTLKQFRIFKLGLGCTIDASKDP